jgi:glycosyltransferase involved in cell wall biosynthesis
VPNAVCHRRFQPECDADRRREVCAKYDIPPEPFLLTLGTIEPRKNLLNTIRAFRLLLARQPRRSLHLVLAGGSGWQKHEELQQVIHAEPRIRYIGYVEDADLPVLYSAAQALCYVSFYEGCGLPLLEAMACGTPVIYGDNSSMPEIAAGCGLPASADDPSSIRDAMDRLAGDESLRRELAAFSVLRAQKFTWQEAARQTLACYQGVIERNRRLTTPSIPVTGYPHPAQRREGGRDAA